MAITLLENSGILTAQRSLKSLSDSHARSAERLASGRRIHRAYDDAAGLALSDALDARVRSVRQAQRNALDALSLIQVAEGGMNEIHNLLIRIRELAVQSSNDTTEDGERALMDIEVGGLVSEIDRMAHSTSFLGTFLLNGTPKSLSFQVGSENSEWDRIVYEAGDIDVRADSLGIVGVSVADADSARDNIDVMDEAIRRVNTPRSQLGAIQTRLHSTGNFLSAYGEGLSQALSRKRDTDFAEESANYFRTQIQMSAAIAVLAQANQERAYALRLLDPRFDRS